MYEDSKRIGDGLKMKNEEKLTSQDADQEREYEELEENQASVIKKLQEQHSELKNNLETLRWQKQNLKEETEAL